MSLVEYGSSDDELDDTSNETVGVKLSSTAKEQTEPKSNSLKLLFASLPKPKCSVAGNNSSSEECEVKDPAIPSHELPVICEKKRKQPVKIFVPNINEFDEDDIPKKKQRSLQVSTGLMDMLPAPKNTTLGKAADKLVPYVLTKKTVKTPTVTTTTKTLKSIPTPANKNSATTLVDYDDKDSDDDDINEISSNSDFFSLRKCESITANNSSNQTLLNVDVTSIPQTLAINDLPHNPTTNVNSKLQMLPTAFVGYDNMDDNDEKVTCSSNSLLETCKPISTSNSSHDLTNVASEIKKETKSASTQSISSNTEYKDVPLNFRSDWASDANFSNSKPQPQQNCKEYNVVHPSQQRTNFVSKPEPQEARNTVEVAKEIDITDERFLRLQGKKQRGKEDIQIIDISADQQLPGVANALMKNLTEEVEYTPSRKKGEMPTTQQRRKHQITYLAFQAKERELELKNQWSSNRMTRHQTQAKYGF